MEILQSGDLLSAVVRDTGLYLPYLKRPGDRPDAMVLDLAAMKLKKRLGVETIRKTDIIKVSYQGSSPDLAARVVRDLADRYLAAHLAAHTSAGVYGFFSDETNKYRSQLTQAQAVASSFRRKAGLFDVGVQRTAAVNRLEDIKVKLSDVAAGLQETGTRIVALRQARDRAAERVSTQKRIYVNQEAVGQLETKVADLENKRLSLLVKFKPSDRLVLETEAQLANTKKNLAAAKSDQGADTTTDINPLRQSLTGELTQAEIDRQGLGARDQALRQQERVYLATLDRLDQSSVQLSNIEQFEKDAEDRYVLYTQRLEQARLAEQMDKRKVANVVLIETPVPAAIPSFPNRTLNLALGALLGICCAVLCSYIFDSSAALQSRPYVCGSRFDRPAQCVFRPGCGRLTCTAVLFRHFKEPRRNYNVFA